jgi:HD-like signal output (HDOD) protein
MTRINCDEALFAGVVHDIGRFYLLSRVAKYPELQGEPVELASLVDAWHPAVGHAILVSLGAPDAVSEAVNRHEDDDVRVPPKDLCDVLNIANRVSHSPNPLNQRSRNSGDRNEFIAPHVFDVVEDSASELRALATALRS